jgi:HlyD family secretion protein
MASGGAFKRRAKAGAVAWTAAAAAVVVAGGLFARGSQGEPSPRPIEAIEWAVATRTDLDTTIVAGGDLQAVKETIVSCQAEDLADADGFLLVELIDNGASVRKGDVLCRLDSSQLEEIARLQEIDANLARSSHTRAVMALEVAETALREYRDGQIRILTKEFQGNIALAKSEAKRQEDRLGWAETMFGKGYVSKGQWLSEKQNLLKARNELKRVEGEMAVFLRYQAPAEVAALKAEVAKAESSLALEKDRLKVAEDRLAYCRKQIENCTIRAPHDGVAVHANRGYWWSRKLEPGIRVYQDQKLFKLPDLSSMEVIASVHETMGPRVKVGMKAGVRVASLDNRVLPATVVSISMFPVVNDKEWDERLRHYEARVRLDATPPRVLPFMSAVVEIDTGRIADALVIPVEALSMVDGRPSCNVLGRNGLERRTIATRHATRDFVEVVEGLSEGERVEIAPAGPAPARSEASA